MNTTIIGVAGGTASGKSTLVKKLQEAFEGESVITLCHDYYYKAHDDLSFEDIMKLKKGRSVFRPVYSFVNHNRTDKTVKVEPAQVIIIDGILILENRTLRELMDVKVYVDTDPDVRLGRRLLRDVQERGRSIESVLTQYFCTVKPMHDEFVEPSKRYADIIIPEGGFNSVAVSMLIHNINSLIHHESERDRR